MDDLLNGLRAAGEATRLRVLVLLAESELTVSNLTWILGQSQPRVSRHLKLLCDAGLVSRYREGSWVYFRSAEQGKGAALARAVVNQVSDDDPLVVRDRERLQALRAKRAEDATRYFRANASAWDRIRVLHVSESRVETAMRKILGSRRFSQLLDLGTGTGRILELLADQCDRGIGVDASTEMLAYARDKLEQGGQPHIQVRHGDIYHLPYDNEMADLVVFHQVLHYLDEPQHALGEAARVLSSDGRMLVVDFAPHELEFLRDKHAHRRLGISADQMTGWIGASGLSQRNFMSLPTKNNRDGDSLTVQLWLIGHERAIKPARGRPKRQLEKTS